MEITLAALVVVGVCLVVAVVSLATLVVYLLRHAQYLSDQQQATSDSLLAAVLAEANSRATDATDGSLGVSYAPYAGIAARSRIVQELVRNRGVAGEAERREQQEQPSASTSPSFRPAPAGPAVHMRTGEDGMPPA